MWRGDPFTVESTDPVERLPDQASATSGLRAHPPELIRLLGSQPNRTEEAWTVFLDAYSRLLLRVAHSLGGGHDAVMDRYAYVLEGLQRKDYARLRSYAPTDGCRFTTWLVVVARRLCLDRERRRYGEAPSRQDQAATARRAGRRRLIDLVGEELDPDALSGPPTDAPDFSLRDLELRRALERALGELESTDRLLVKLRFEFDLSGREIAGVLGLPSEFHAYRRLKRVLSALRDGLVRRGVTDSAP